MLKKYCKTQKTYYLRNLNQEEKKQMVRFAPYALKKHPKGSKDYNKALEIMDILSESPVHCIDTDCNSLGYLDNKGSSCYLDSSLFGLFIFPCEFVQNILHNDLHHRNRFDCGSTAEEDLNNRKLVQKALVNIEELIHGEETTIKNCTNLRRVLKNCPHPENYHLPGQKDAGEFLQYILDMFPTNLAIKKTTVYGTNSSLEKVPENELYKTSESVDEHSSIMQFVPSTTLVQLPQKNSTDIRNFLYQTDDTGKFEGFTDEESGQHFTRKITTTTMEYTPYLIFRIERLGYQGVLSTPILPSETVRLESGKSFSLSAIVTYSRRHYICYFKCRDDWYLYDDISGISDVGKYKDMIYSKPSPVKYGTLYFYIPF